jgi:hypothetical protein
VPLNLPVLRFVFEVYGNSVAVAVDVFSLDLFE